MKNWTRMLVGDYEYLFADRDIPMNFRLKLSNHNTTEYFYKSLISKKDTLYYYSENNLWFCIFPPCTAPGHPKFNVAMLFYQTKKDIVNANLLINYHSYMNMSCKTLKEAEQKLETISLDDFVVLKALEKLHG